MPEIATRAELIEPAFGQDGLIPAICQHAETGRVLMFAYMNQEALARTRASGDAWFWSRSRQELWHKGATSGNFLRVRSIAIDCDADALLLQVLPAGPACHTGQESCFYRVLQAGQGVGPGGPERSPGPPVDQCALGGSAAQKYPRDG